MSAPRGPYGPVENRLLSALPAQDDERLLPHLQPVTFPLGKVVYESGGRLDSMYFPTTALVSLLYTMADGATRKWGSPATTGW